MVLHTSPDFVITDENFSAAQHRNPTNEIGFEIAIAVTIAFVAAFAVGVFFEA